MSKAKKLGNADKIIQKAQEESKNKKWVRYCPECGDIEVSLVTYNRRGSYRCNKCGYIGRVFPEKEIKK